MYASPALDATNFVGKGGCGYDPEQLPLMVKPGPGRLKPLARAIRNRVLSRHAGAVLGRELEQEIFIKARVLSEGGYRAVPEGHESYFGSTMISVPLLSLARVTRGDLDQSARDQLERAVAGRCA